MGFRFNYGGHQYVSRDALVFQPISEFNTAIRQGAPSNDDRNLASFLSYEDARGGVGTVFGSVRDDPDKIADSDGLLTFKFNQAILPPKLYLEPIYNTYLGAESEILVDAGAPRAIFHDVVDAAAGGSDWASGEAIQIMYGNRIWQATEQADETFNWGADATPPSLVGPGANFGTGATQDGLEWVNQAVRYMPADGTWVGEDRIVYAGVEGTVEHRLMGDGSHVAAAVSGHTVFEFDGKVFVGGPNSLEWSIDLDTWTPMAPIGAWPMKWRVFGVFPFGQTFWPYALTDDDSPDKCRLAVIDLDANRVVPISLGITGIIDAFPVDGKICIVHDQGKAASIYDPRANTPIDLDWRAQTRDGFLASRDGVAVSGATGPQGLTGRTVLFNLREADEESQIFIHRGTGWVPYGKKIDGAVIPGGYYSPLFKRFFFPVVITGQDDLYMAYIKWFDEAYKPGGDQSMVMEGDTLYLYTPWFDMGFSELKGTLIALSFGGYADAQNSVVVAYQLDDMSLEITDSWTALGTFPNTAPGSPEITGRLDTVEDETTLLFGTDPNTLAGVSFTRVRFRVALDNGSETMQSPNGYPLTVRFIKRPDLRESIRIAVDVAETLAVRDDLTGFDDLWIELKQVYDSKTIPKLEVGPYTTWASMIALPRVLNVESPTEDDVARTVLSEQIDIVINVAELV